MFISCREQLELKIQVVEREQLLKEDNILISTKIHQERLKSINNAHFNMMLCERGRNTHNLPKMNEWIKEITICAK